MGAAAVELIDPRRPDDAVRIYSGTFGWPLSVGHRHRPRQGCTCQQARECPVPGAHPVPNAPVFHAGEDVARVLGQSPGAGLIAWTVTFDALVVPRTIGMAAMITLDRIAPVPCLLSEEKAVLLVLPATGRYAVATGPCEVRSGQDQWIALPPSHGVRWDTTPWIEQTSEPVGLLHGMDVGRHLRAAMRLDAGRAR
ncbi:hypothetical protein ACFFSH_31565 [Streptomyces filamentosus]|uniref:DNA primase n=1 Tax=Streptomyces filamentosus TaxID=67294 RepID=A0A919ERM1_STRFL|nr:hypothetical protein [Streptomyces filamentosus]GHG13277.1 hypothetical protein GCM10017667_53840 [Streptomyces filamentosus]